MNNEKIYDPDYYPANNITKPINPLGTFVSDTIFETADRFQEEHPDEYKAVCYAVMGVIGIVGCTIECQRICSHKSFKAIDDSQLHSDP